MTGEQTSPSISTFYLSPRATGCADSADGLEDAAYFPCILAEGRPAIRGGVPQLRTTGQVDAVRSLASPVALHVTYALWPYESGLAPTGPGCGPKDFGQCKSGYPTFARQISPLKLAVSRL